MWFKFIRDDSDNDQNAMSHDDALKRAKGTIWSTKIGHDFGKKPSVGGHSGGDPPGSTSHDGQGGGEPPLTCHDCPHEMPRRQAKPSFAYLTKEHVVIVLIVFIVCVALRVDFNTFGVVLAISLAFVWKVGSHRWTKTAMATGLSVFVTVAALAAYAPATELVETLLTEEEQPSPEMVPEEEFFLRDRLPPSLGDN